jgi:FMN-dependent oxidoreductase (nitrilotriacetate monooxygenase family)
VSGRRRLLLSAFTGLGLPNHGPGLWWHPDAGRIDHNDLGAWVALARSLELGGFDLLFLADAVGAYDVYRGSVRQAVVDAIGIPSNDPSVIISALAAATTHLGLTFTSSTLQEHPFNFARKLSSLDHFSRGRVGWNIVTGYANAAARNFGREAMGGHDDRYRQAEEYVEVTYGLWERSWDEGAVHRDAGRRLYADPDAVHAIDHHGEHYRVAGPHLPEPSPQRTPLLFQAGASAAGRGFAARHAEGVFLIAYDPPGARAHIADVRARARKAGRRDEDVLFFQGLWFVIGSTVEEARRRESELLEWVSIEGVLADLSGKLGVDLSAIDLDRPVGELRVDGVQGIIDGLRERLGGADGTFRDLVFHLLGARIVGTPEQIVEELARWQQAGVDGINVMDVPAHGTFAEFAEHVVPVLQQQGLVPRERTPATLRAQLFGTDRLNSRHPARRPTSRRALA